MKIFNLDSPLMEGLGKMADLMWLNVLTIICSLPIVTMGASLTALNYMTLKIVRNEECYVTKGFFKSFKQNFKQATIIWMILLTAGILIAIDFLIMKDSQFQYNSIVQMLIMVCAFLLLMVLVFIFPVLAKFDNTVKNTIKNAFMISIMQFPKTVIMIILYAIPIIIFFFIVSWMPVTFLFGLSGPAFLGALMYNKFFKKMEDQIMSAAQTQETDAAEEDERIFRDELDPSLTDHENLD